MKFNATVLSVAALTATVATATISAAPVQAATISAGSVIQFSSPAGLPPFLDGGGVSYVGGVANPTGLNFFGTGGVGSGFETGPLFETGDANTVFSGTAFGTFAGLGLAGAAIKDIDLVDLNSGNPLFNFLTILSFGGSLPGETTFSITNILSAFAIDANSQTTSARFGGFFSNNGNITPGFVSFSAQSNANPSTYSLTFTAIPTPALLPGLVAMGIGVIRKKKQQVEA